MMNNQHLNSQGNEDLSPEPPLWNDRFQPLVTLGEGSFGQVVKCLDHQTKEEVAIKCLKGPDSMSLGLREFGVLEELKKALDLDRVNIIELKHSFVLDLHQACLVFPFYGMDLHRYIDGCPLPLNSVRIVAIQLLVALSALQGLHIIHTDIKPLNIMVMGTQGEAIRVKLVDFGSAIHSNGKKVESDITTPQYRAPEVVVGLPSDECVDMWAVGCVLVQMFTGRVLYKTRNEFELLRSFAVSHKDLPEIFAQGTRAHKFFRSASGLCFKSLGRHKCQLPGGLDDLKELYLPALDGMDMDCEKLDRLLFNDILKSIMALDPGKRIQPAEALLHDWITLEHVLDFECPHVQNFIASLNSLTWMKGTL